MKKLVKTQIFKRKIKQIRKDLYEIENQKSLSKSRIKEIKINLFELEESLSNLKSCYDYDDIKYKGIRGIYSICQLMNIIINQQQPIVFLMVITWSTKVMAIIKDN